MIATFLTPFAFLEAPIVLASFAHYFFGILMSVTAVFVILLVLVQRGRGGGLAGAFGGMGGQSAFGTKAGDTFTRVTISVAIFWIIVCVAAIKFLSSETGAFGPAGPAEEASLDLPPSGSEAVPSSDAGGAAPTTETPATPATSAPATSEPAPSASTPAAAPADATAPASEGTPAAK